MDLENKAFQNRLLIKEESILRKACKWDHTGIKNKGKSYTRSLQSGHLREMREQVKKCFFICSIVHLYIFTMRANKC